MTGLCVAARFYVNPTLSIFSSTLAWRLSGQGRVTSTRKSTVYSCTMRHESWTISFPKELVKCLFCCKCPGMAAALYRNGSQFLFVSKCPGIGAALYRNGIISILFSTVQTFD